MTTIMVNGNIESAIRRLRRWFDMNLKKELKSRQGYATKAQRRKAKDQIARRRKKRMLARHRQFNRPK